MLRRITAAMVAVTLLEVGAAGMANAHERPASEILNAVRSCFGKAGIKSSSASDKSMQVTAGQRKAVDKCLQESGIEIPDGRP